MYKYLFCTVHQASTDHRSSNRGVESPPPYPSCRGLGRGEGLTPRGLCPCRGVPGLVEPDRLAHIWAALAQSIPAALGPARGVCPWCWGVVEPKTRNINSYFRWYFVKGKKPWWWKLHTFIRFPFFFPIKQPCWTTNCLVTHIKISQKKMNTYKINEALVLIIFLCYIKDLQNLEWKAKTHFDSRKILNSVTTYQQLTNPGCSFGGCSRPCWGSSSPGGGPVWGCLGCLIGWCCHWMWWGHHWSHHRCSHWLQISSDQVKGHA